MRLVIICGEMTLVGTCFQFHLKSGADDDDDDDDDDYPNKCCGLITVQYLIVDPVLLDTCRAGVVPPWSGMWSDGTHLELGLITLFLIVQTLPQTLPTISTSHSLLVCISI